MKAKFSTTWNASKKPRKQRKFQHNAPLHIKKKFLGVHLDKELRKTYSTRTIRIRSGDKVVVLRGKFKKLIGKVESVDTKNANVFVVGADVQRKDGTKGLYPINPSNLKIIELNLDDQRRKKSLTRKNSNGKQNKEITQKPKQETKQETKQEVKNKKKQSEEEPKKKVNGQINQDKKTQ